MVKSTSDKFDDIVEDLMAPIEAPNGKEQARLGRLAEEICHKLPYEATVLRDELRRRRIPERVRMTHTRSIKCLRRILAMRFRDIIGEMSEKYRSPHAWLFIPDSRGTLRALFSYRSCMRNERVRMDEPAIISQVARTLQPYTAADTRKDPFYKEWLPSTLSEMAVPIVSPGPRAERKLLGVMNFESHELGNFTKEKGRQAEIYAKELALPLICLKSGRLGDLGRWPFYPDSFGWTPDTLLHRMCSEFTSALARKHSGSDLSATIWLADWEEMLLWARAPVGYDYEYRAQPLEGETVTWSGAKAERGKVIRTTPDDPLFKDKEKAKKMGMVRLLTTPIFDEPTAERSLGALNVAQFRTVYPEVEVTKDALPTDKTVMEFARLVGEATAGLERIREEAACAYLDWKMEESRFSTDAGQVAAAQFHILKEVMRECFAADGCSIFLPDENNEYLDLVSSTGIRGERLELHEGLWVVRKTEPMRYSLRDPMNRSVMQFLFDNPGMSLVLNRVSDITRHRRMLAQGLPTAIYPVGMEHITPADVEERRFVGIGIRTQDRTAMVVRLVRSSEHPPFTVADGRLLEALAGLCSRSAYWTAPTGNMSADCVRPPAESLEVESRPT